MCSLFPDFETEAVAKILDLLHRGTTVIESINVAHQIKAIVKCLQIPKVIMTRLQGTFVSGTVTNCILDWSSTVDLNTNHLNIKLFEVWISIGLVFQRSVYVLCPVYKTNHLNTKHQYKRKQDGIHLLGIQMVWLSGIQMVFEYWTIWHPTSF